MKKRNRRKGVTSREAEDRFLVRLFGVVLVIIIITWLMSISGCTLTTGTGTTESDAHTSTLPAVQICILAACDGQWADRTQRAGDDADESGETIGAAQTATSVPTVSIPLPNTTPLEAAEAAERALE